MTTPDILIVEDGSVIDQANAYISLVDTDTYHYNRGNTRWNDFSSLQKQTAIIRATDYIDQRFGRRFRGARVTTFQYLQWPRLSAFDDSGFILGGDGRLPKQLVKAVAEYSLRAAIRQVLAPDPLQAAPAEDMTTGSTPTDPDDVVSGLVTRRTEKVGPIEETIQYQTAAQIAQGRTGSRSQQSSIVDDIYIPEYPIADMWLEELLNNVNISGVLLRGD